MTITYLSGNRIQGTSSDTKPTNVIAGSIFQEVMSGAGLRRQYMFDGSSTWNQMEATLSGTYGETG